MCDGAVAVCEGTPQRRYACAGRRAAAHRCVPQGPLLGRHTHIKLDVPCVERARARSRIPREIYRYYADNGVKFTYNKYCHGRLARANMMSARVSALPRLRFAAKAMPTCENTGVSLECFLVNVYHQSLTLTIVCFSVPVFVNV